MATPARPSERELLYRMIAGYQATQLIYVAAKLGIADLLADGPKTAEELAARAGANPDRLYRVLRALASMDAFEERDGRSFALTPMSETLRTDHPGSLRPMAIFLGGTSYRSWSELLYGVTTGETPAEKVFGMSTFEYLQKDLEAGAAFDATMSAVSWRDVAAVVDAYDFSSARTVVDVGGGHGTLIAGILGANPQLRGILFDQPNVVAGAQATLEEAGVADRCERVGGDFFREVPAGGDIYIMRSIIHDWDDAPAIVILGNCVRAMGENGKVLLVESVIEGGDVPAGPKMLDVQMLVMTGGRERTAEEFRALYSAAGLELTRIIPAGVEARIVEGVVGGGGS